eukprot:scaffold1201_cov247-Pinguiococcus_pyrenoidosus.AAC.4
MAASCGGESNSNKNQSHTHALLFLFFSVFLSTSEGGDVCLLRLHPASRQWVRSLGAFWQKAASATCETKRNNLNVSDIQQIIASSKTPRL